MISFAQYFSRTKKVEFSDLLSVRESSQQHIIQQINTHYTARLVLKDIANRSCGHLPHLLKKLGFTFTEYLCGIQLAYICQLLAPTGKSVRDFSMEVEFPDERAVQSAIGSDLSHNAKGILLGISNTSGSRYVAEEIRKLAEIFGSYSNMALLLLHLQ